MSLLDTASLIVTPNGYKEGKLYSVIPSDGSGDMSVTRATTATRVNSAGLVELVPYNLLGYSEDFTNASWLKGASTITGNTTTAPNGTLTADTFTGNGASDLHIVLWQTDVIGVGNTISVYAKKNTNDFLQIYTDFVNTDFANFDLANGTTGSVGSSVISSSIESVGNGWYRCSFVVGSSASKFVNFCLVTSSTAGRAETNTLNTSVFLWGAQLNEGTLKPYQKTETRLNIPRLDYSNGTCPSILVEPQRTNLLTYSSSFDNAAWVKSSTTITANTTISPSGVQDAETAVFGSNGQVYKPISSNAVNTFSAYVKKGTNRYFSMQLETNSVVYRAIYDLDTASVTFTGTNTSASITDEGNGWFRVSVVNTTSDAIAYTTLQAASSGTSVSGGSGTFYIWGAQLEAGSYPTSYIPTTSASVTRNADVISKTGISSLIGQTEGTLFAEIDWVNNGNDVVFSTISDGTTSNRIHFGYAASGNSWYLYVESGGASQVNITLAAPTNGKYRLAVAYKLNDYAFYVNGVQIGTDTSATVPSTSQLNVGGFITTGLEYSNNATALWKTRLTNDQLATLTTL